MERLYFLDKLKIAFAICFKTLQAAYQVSCRNLRFAIEQGQPVAPHICHTMKNEELCKELLEKLLHIKIDHIIYPELEKELTAYYEMKSVRLDVYVKDSDKIFDIEMQNQPTNYLPLRTRYYQSMIDVDNLLKGEEYSNLKESFIIFICQFDPFNENLPCYTFKNICKENTNIELQDKTSKIIFNSTAYDKEKDIEISSF